MESSVLTFLSFCFLCVVIFQYLPRPFAGKEELIYSYKIDQLTSSLRTSHIFFTGTLSPAPSTVTVALR